MPKALGFFNLYEIWTSYSNSEYDGKQQENHETEAMLTPKSSKNIVTYIGCLE